MVTAHDERSETQVTIHGEADECVSPGCCLPRAPGTPGTALPPRGQAPDDLTRARACRGASLPPPRRPTDVALPAALYHFLYQSVILPNPGGHGLMASSPAASAAGRHGSTSRP